MTSASSAAGGAGRIGYLDGWRGVSIALVLVGHFLPGQERLGGLGVNLFFALSGRLMAEILFVKRFPLAEFYRRRLSRIYPALAAFVLIAWLALRGTSLAIDGASVAAALSFTFNYRLAFGDGAAALQNLWSLCVEEHAYVLLGGLAFLLRRGRMNPAWPLLAIGALSLADGGVSLALGQEGRTVFWRTDAQLAPIFLAAGTWLALRGRPLPGWAPLAAALAAGLSFGLGPVVAYAVSPALLALAIGALEAAPKEVQRALAWSPLARLGVCSYSIYLWQHPFYRLALEGTLAWWAALPAALAAGMVSFHLIEEPARRWLNGAWRGRGAAPAPAT